MPLVFAEEGWNGIQPNTQEEMAEITLDLWVHLDRWLRALTRYGATETHRTTWNTNSALVLLIPDQLTLIRLQRALEHFIESAAPEMKAELTRLMEDAKDAARASGIQVVTAESAQ